MDCSPPSPLPSPLPRDRPVPPLHLSPACNLEGLGCRAPRSPSCPAASPSARQYLRSARPSCLPLHPSSSPISLDLVLFPLTFYFASSAFSSLLSERGLRCHGTLSKMRDTYQDGACAEGPPAGPSLPLLLTGRGCPPLPTPFRNLPPPLLSQKEEVIKPYSFHRLTVRFLVRVSEWEGTSGIRSNQVSTLQTGTLPWTS